MPVTALVVVAATVAAFAVAGWIYRTRELPVRGRSLFSLLRGTTLAVVVLLLWNPDLPGRSSAASAPPVLVIDASPSMSASEASAPTPAERATDLAEDFAGTVVRTEGGLSDAVATAVESGAGRVAVATDLRAGDGVALRALAAESTVPIEVVDLGAPVANAGIASVSFPDRAEPGDEVVATIRVHATDSEPRDVLLIADGDTLGRATVIPGAPGTDQPVEIAFTVPEPAPEERGRLAVEAHLVADDAYPEDDRRLGVLGLRDFGGGIVAVSWAPDWEFRSLIPLLDEVSGLRARGFHALADGRWLRLSDVPAVVDGAEVRAALSRAEMTVLQAPPPQDTGLVALARGVPRRFELAPASAAATDDVGPGPAQPGEWYVAADLPASPIAAELTGLELLGLPPLGEVRTGGTAEGAPILLQRGGTGTPVPAFDLRLEDGERVVTARAEGFWRWALREGDAHELYRRLWSGLAAWALTPDGTTRTSGFGPRGGDVAPGQPVDVLVGTEVPDSGSVVDSTEVSAAGSAVEVAWSEASSGTTLRVDTIPVEAGPVARVPGFDRRMVVDWTARLVGPGAEAAGSPTASGSLGVQPSGSEMRVARDTTLVGDIAGMAPNERPSGATRGALRDAWWPWLLLVGLLSAEWVGRRRAGLR